MPPAAITAIVRFSKPVRSAAAPAAVEAIRQHDVPVSVVHREGEEPPGHAKHQCCDEERPPPPLDGGDFMLAISAEEAAF